MNREQFYHLLRASAEIVERQRAVRGIDVNEQPARIIVIGSQSILGSWSDEYLPDYTTRSAEMDVAFMPTAGDEYAFDLPRQELADLTERDFLTGLKNRNSFDEAYFHYPEQ